MVNDRDKTRNNEFNFDQSYLSLVNSGTPYLLLYFQPPITTLFRGEGSKTFIPVIWITLSDIVKSEVMGVSKRKEQMMLNVNVGGEAMK